MNVKRIDSSDENVSKFVFDFDGTAVAESVLYKYPTYEERTVICCSTQSGCPVGCRFCGTGEYFVRNLSAAEIVGQVDHLMSTTGVDPDKIQRFQIMFMSMGEPLLNWNNLSLALTILAVKYPKARLLISTSAPDVPKVYQELRLMSIQIEQIGLQFSVHESTDEARNKLIPFKAKLSLEQVSEQGRFWFNATGRQPFFNYCAHEANSSAADVGRLVELFDPAIWQSTVSVVCEREESIAAANERQRTLATDFMDKLLEVGYSTRCFDPAGQDDIGGGCGQLWFVQDWMKNHPELARPTCGDGKAVVHAPRVIPITASV